MRLVEAGLRDLALRRRTFACAGMHLHCLKNGAPERIRTSDPQIRSLTTVNYSKFLANSTNYHIIDFMSFYCYHVF